MRDFETPYAPKTASQGKSTTRPTAWSKPSTEENMFAPRSGAVIGAIAAHVKELMSLLCPLRIFHTCTTKDGQARPKLTREIRFRGGLDHDAQLIASLASVDERCLSPT